MGHLTDSAREHLTPLDPLSAGDASGAERLMREHIRHVRGIWADRPE